MFGICFGRLSVPAELRLLLALSAPSRAMRFIGGYSYSILRVVSLPHHYQWSIVNSQL